jgi:hypothetical protein
MNATFLRMPRIGGHPDHLADVDWITNDVL